VTVTIRVAGPEDSVFIAALMHQLGYRVAPERIRENLFPWVKSAMASACWDMPASGNIAGVIATAWVPALSA
jgi:hypothetical protein